MFTTPFAFMAAPAGGGFSYLLDDYPSAGVAYSLRKLRSAYAGNCIEVRRSSDNATQNIGFVNNVLDTASLLTFCGAGNGFVKTWYDQSGNAANATQTTSADQPTIVLSGVVQTENSLPTVRFTGGGVFMNFSPSISQPDTVFLAAKSNGTYAKHFFDSNGSRQLIGYTANFISFAGGGIIDYGSNITTFQLASGFFNGASSDLQSNDGPIVTGNPGSGSLTGGCLLMAGNPGSTLGTLGVMSEFVVYPSDQTSNRTGIKTNINDFYSIY